MPDSGIPKHAAQQEISPAVTVIPVSASTEIATFLRYGMRKAFGARKIDAALTPAIRWSKQRRLQPAARLETARIARTACCGDLEPPLGRNPATLAETYARLVIIPGLVY